MYISLTLIDFGLPYVQELQNQKGGGIGCQKLENRIFSSKILLTIA